MQRLEVSGAVRHIYIYISLGGKGLSLGVAIPLCVYDKCYNISTAKHNSRSI
jgi:hypothetical protein